ncbi:MAG: M48 family metallopeptidase [Planctomycetes bacterium]|nr:M48 family metallopeptidase [Planctomycetota bacterium]
MSSSPIPYSIRVSARARYLRFRVTVDKGLEVVVPRGYDQRRIPDVLTTNQHWVQTAMQRVEEVRRRQSAEATQAIPTTITFPSVGRVWHVEAVATRARTVTIEEPTRDRLIVRGRIEDTELCEAALQRWVMRQAHDILIPWLGQISREIGIPFTKTAIRKQKSRWGSCSRIGTISLNSKLLFIEPDLVRYILIHELCHIREMNHSPRFWKLVSNYYRPYKQAHPRLTVAWRTMPRWVG